MPQTNLFFKTLRRITMMGFLLLFGMSAFAVIPATIANLSSYSVTGTESSLGSVILQPSSMLVITGAAANAVINGDITVGHGAELQIYSGATVTFNGNVTINPGGILRVYNYNAPSCFVKMGTGTKISLKGNTSLVSGGAWAHIEYANISCATPGGFWKGFETSVTGSGTYTHSTQISISYSVVENAICAYRNYDSDNSNISATAGGFMAGAENIYRNNIRHLAIYNQTGVSVPTDALNTFYYNEKVVKLFNCEFINNAGFTSSPAPVDMVYLNNSSNISFYNCKFRNLGDQNAINTCINAVNSGFFLQGSTYSYAGSSSRDTISGFATGVTVTNSLQTDRVCVITNTDFDRCAKSINMSGCLNPYILNCRFQIPFYNFPPAQPPYNVLGAYLNNCTGYKIEGNYSFDHPGAGPFVVVHNSGAAYNEIYRNRPVYSMLGIQAVGINRDASGNTGLKILCNDVSGNTTGISMIADPLVLPGIAQGVSNQQFTISGIFNITSAGNRFAQDPNRWDIYADPNLNTSSLIYRYRSAGIAEQPVSHNLSGSVAATSYNNTCPVRNAGATPQPFPFSQFVAQNTAIEEKINVMLATAPDPSDEATELALAPLYTQHAQNIDAIATYYQYMAARDTTGHHEDYQDSIERVYETVTVGYEYKIYLASAYADKGAYDKAIKTLTELPEKYKLTDDEQQYMRNLQDLFTVRQWLYQNEGNWREIPADLKEMVYTHEKNDPMFAGAMARAIRAQYEGATYDPYYVIPPMPVKQQTSKMIKGLSDSKIYPNPTTGYATITWTGDDAVLVLNNMNGPKVYQTHIKSGKNELDLSRLASGTYVAQIIVNGKQVYQQHLVKK